MRYFTLLVVLMLCAFMAACAQKQQNYAIKPNTADTAQSEAQAPPAEAPPLIPPEMSLDWAVSQIEEYQAAVHANQAHIDGEKDICGGGSVLGYALVGMVEFDGVWWLRVRYSNDVDGHLSRITDYFVLPDGTVREGAI